MNNRLVDTRNPPLEEYSVEGKYVMMSEYYTVLSRTAYQMIKTLFTATLIAAAALAANRVASKDAPAGNFNIPLWDDGKVPMAAGDGPLDKPFLTAFLPPEGKRNGGAIVIAPGGANIMLMYGAEGIDIAERYNDWGIAAFVLTYRLSPRYNDQARTADGQRAIRVVRAHAAEWKLDPKRIGFIGFSAGSNMGRLVVASSGPGDPNAADAVDRLSSRPDYLGLVYGPGRATPGESLKDFPPTFLCAAQWDRGPSLGSAQLFTELTRAGAVAELHLYQKGRHGFGSGYGTREYADWMPALKRFLDVGGFLTSSEARQ